MVEPRYQTYSDLLDNKQIPEDVKDLVLQRHTIMRGDIGQAIGAIELAYRRGVMAGHEESHEALEAAVQFLWPEITRGPALPDWIKAMRKVGKALDWDPCHGCGGDGGLTRPHPDNCCGVCIGVGAVPPE